MFSAPCQVIPSQVHKQVLSAADDRARGKVEKVAVAHWQSVTVDVWSLFPARSSEKEHARLSANNRPRCA